MGQDKAEALDDDMLGGDLSPNAPLGVEDFGTTPAEERYGEPLDERVRREQPDVTIAVDDPVVLPAGPADAEPDIGEMPDRNPTDGPLAEEDTSSGDITTRDVATEHEAPLPAEEAAVHQVPDTEI